MPPSTGSIAVLFYSIHNDIGIVRWRSDDLIIVKNESSDADLTIRSSLCLLLVFVMTQIYFYIQKTNL